MKHLRQISRMPKKADVFTEYVAPVLGIISTIVSTVLPIIMLVNEINRKSSEEA
jgi:hypothetical protein